jgi:hypothetical protein
MKGWKLGMVAAAAVLVVVAGLDPGSAEGAGGRAATGVGSCTLKNWNPNTDPEDAKDLPEGQRPQSYKPDDYNCTGASFAAPGVEFTRFPQPKDFHVTDQQTIQPVRGCPAANGATQLTLVALFAAGHPRTGWMVC